MNEYILGNWTNGYHAGKFNSIEEAWAWLTKRSYLSFPYNRHVHMWVKRENEFGYWDKSKVKEGKTGQYPNMTDEEKDEVLERCDINTRSYFL